MKHSSITNNDIKVLGRVVSLTSNNTVASAEQIWDDNFNANDIEQYYIGQGANQYDINRAICQKLMAVSQLFSYEGGVITATAPVKIPSNFLVGGESVFGGAVHVYDDLIVMGDVRSRALDDKYNVTVVKSGISPDEDPSHNGVYTFRQNGNVIGTINIKDFFIVSGHVEGTDLYLTLNSDPVVEVVIPLASVIPTVTLNDVLANSGIGTPSAGDTLCFNGTKWELKPLASQNIWKIENGNLMLDDSVADSISNIVLDDSRGSGEVYRSLTVGAIETGEIYARDYNDTTNVTSISGHGIDTPNITANTVKATESYDSVSGTIANLGTINASGDINVSGNIEADGGITADQYITSNGTIAAQSTIRTYGRVISDGFTGGDGEFSSITASQGANITGQLDATRINTGLIKILNTSTGNTTTIDSIGVKCDTVTANAITGKVIRAYVPSSEQTGPDDLGMIIVDKLEVRNDAEFEKDAEFGQDIVVTRHITSGGDITAVRSVVTPLLETTGTSGSIDIHCRGNLMVTGSINDSVISNGTITPAS